MTQRLAILGGSLFWATSAAAHSGAHLHPHDGAHWLVMAGALSVLALAAGLGVARARSRK